MVPRGLKHDLEMLSFELETLDFLPSTLGFAVAASARHACPLRTSSLCLVRCSGWLMLLRVFVLHC